MAVLGIPITHADAEPLLGNSFTYLGSSVLQHAAERFSVQRLVDFWGDLSKSGSDTIARRRVTGFGASATMTTLSTETQLVAPSAISAAMDTMTLGQHAVSWEETFFRALLEGDGITLDAVAAAASDTVETKLRQMVALEISTLGNNTADAAAAADVDDVIATRAAFEDSVGFDAARSRVVAMLSPTQIRQIRSSLRSETALKFPDRFDADQALQSNAGFRFDLLEMGHFASSDVVVSSGDSLGAYWQLGAIGWCKGSPSVIGGLDPMNTAFVDAIGLAITRDVDLAQSLKQLILRLYAGVGRVSFVVAPAFQFRSQN